MSAIIAHTRDKDAASIPTIVHVVTKKNALDFDFSAPGLIGDILRTSTLGPVYQRIKTEWKSLNTNDESNFTNIMYIPNLYVFSDGNESLFYPFKINLLIVSVPTCKRHKEEISDDTINPATDYIGRVIGDIMESASKISGCDELIVDPYALKITKDYPQEVINMWNYVMSTPKIKKSINKVWFTIDDEYNYVLFVANSVTKLSSILTKTTIDNVHPDEDDEDDEDDDITKEIVGSINQSNHDKTVIIESLSESDADD
jgi:hypothetical protein